MTQNFFILDKIKLYDNDRECFNLGYFEKQYNNSWEKKSNLCYFFSFYYL